MYYVKMMSDENIPDGDCSKGFKLIEVKGLNSVTFKRVLAEDATERKPEGSPIVCVWCDKECTEMKYYPDGNTYVQNEKGDTIATFYHDLSDVGAMDLWYGAKSRKSMIYG